MKTKLKNITNTDAAAADDDNNSSKKKIIIIITFIYIVIYSFIYFCNGIIPVRNNLWHSKYFNSLTNSMLWVPIRIVSSRRF